MNRGEVRGKEVVWLDLGEDVSLGSHTHIHTSTHTRHLWVASDRAVEGSSITSHDHPVW